MSDEEVVSEDLTLESRTWHQMEKNLQQFGYREGAAKGRDSTFQSGFDEGYCDGFERGKAVGQAKGILSCLESLDSENLNKMKENVNCVMEKIVKTPCTLCSDNKDELTQLTFNDLLTKQEKYRIQVFEAVQDLKTAIKAGQG